MTTNTTVNSISNQWAPLIYARTYEVDFRLIAVPEDFTQQDENWAIQHILTSTRVADQLPQRPRWSMFMNESHCVVGVTCMASELLQSIEPDSPDPMTKDARNRPVYLFVGYVALRNAYTVPNLAVFADRQLEQFSDLYELVRDRWFVRPYQPESQMSLRCTYRVLPSTQVLPNLSQNDLEYFELNQTNSNRIRLWADAEQNHLWLATIQQALASQPPSLTLCLGLANQNIAINSCFLNATASGVHQREDVEKRLPQALYPVQPVEASAPQRDDELPPPRWSPTRGVTGEEMAGAVVGSMVGATLAVSFGLPGGLFGGVSVAAGVVIGGVAGLTVAGYLTGQNVGEDQATHSEKFKAASRSRHPRHSRRTGRDSRDHYGLKFRDEQSGQSSRAHDDWF